MYAKTLKVSGASRIAVLVLAVLIASCEKPSYKIGGTVSGLTGTGLVLRNNGGDNLAISANGAFTFSTQLKKDASYSVTVFTQPSGQTCTVTNGTGTAKGNVTNVAVACAGSGFTVGGSVTGLTGTGLVLQNNGGSDLAISASGAFTFPGLLANAASYNVTVRTLPTGQGCAVANGSGTIAGANVTNVAVTCATAPSAPNVNAIEFGVKELQFSWSAVGGATSYRLLESPDGGPVFNIRYKDIAFLSAGEGLGYNFLRGMYYRVGVSVGYDSGRREADEYDHLRGLGNISIAPSVKLFGSYVLSKAFPMVVQADIRQIIGGALNCTYDIFAASEEEFALIFPSGADVEFISDFYDRAGEETARSDPESQRRLSPDTWPVRSDTLA